LPALAWMQPHWRDMHDSAQQVASLNLVLDGRTRIAAHTSMYYTAYTGTFLRFPAFMTK